MDLIIMLAVIALGLAYLKWQLSGNKKAWWRTSRSRPLTGTIRKA